MSQKTLSDILTDRPEQVLLDLLARLGVGRDACAALPRFDGFVAEARFFVEDGEVLQRGEALRVQLDRFLELLDALVDAAFLSVEKAEVEAQAEGERVDRDAALEVRDGVVDAAGLYASMPFVSAASRLRRRIGLASGRWRRRASLASERCTAATTSARRNGFSRYSSMP